MAEDSESGLLGMGLALPGRADDGAGQLVPELAHLTGVCVLPYAQGAGVGGQLLDYLLDEVKATGSARATLWTHGTNQQAQRLFESRGFRPTGRSSTDDLGNRILHFEAQLATGREA